MSRAKGARATAQLYVVQQIMIKKFILFSSLMISPLFIRGAGQTIPHYDSQKNEIVGCDDEMVLPNDAVLVIYKSAFFGDPRSFEKIDQAYYRPLLLFTKSKTFAQVSGPEISKDQEMFVPNSDNKYLMKREVTINPLGTDSCYWMASTKQGGPELLASKKLNGFNTEISASTLDRFNKAVQSKKCWKETFKESGYPIEGPLTCERKLLAVSDLNSNGKTEYWFKDEQAGGPGFSVGEIDLQSGNLEILATDGLPLD